MRISNGDRAKILVQALPYIQTHAGRTVVVKYGGSAMTDGALKDAVMSDIVLMQLVGIRVVLVHGGGREISAVLGRLGIESRFVGGLRYTGPESIGVVQMVLAGKVNKDLVRLLERHGGRAVGLCGLDDGMLKARRRREPPDLGFVGEITSVNPAALDNATRNGYVPVVAPIAGGEDGQVYNINADVAASRIAAELKAEKLILMTDVRGLLRDKDDESTLIPVVNVSDVPRLRKQGVVTGGMIPKVACCVDAVRRGVGRAHIIDGRIPHSILVELFSDEGIGTMFR
ncbi:MAG TPA: acetylglutamate kinase [Ruminococcaceae bacterium]|jgi:acetylglutamate kinase|nr:acetylglutamate kinase [Oscillospiraceae bacterium]HBG55903.1 acetylglutamate kinase [Oscillospiraceae bacterium]HBQ47012.1 acetylglutamate kinase [Oscillospiraceae bacterium]HBT90376.1 acetylglutamate kinase [Oscillospiraceae bacterium]HCB91006.1 acetylglutamate kinase [Oscillospiraceae bacterium]